MGHMESSKESGPALAFELKGRRTAFLVIDMQYLCAHPDYGIGRDGRAKGLEEKNAHVFRSVRQIIPNIEALLEAARGAGIQVIFVRVASQTKDGRDGIPSLRGGRDVVGTCLYPEDSKEAQILEEIRPLPGDIVLSKTSFSAFNSTSIDQMLRNLGVDTLILSGMVTDGCVELTARDAADRGYVVVLASDACAAHQEEYHLNALERMDVRRRKAVDPMVTGFPPIFVATTREILVDILAEREPAETGTGR